jgi:hypothetical protein
MLNERDHPTQVPVIWGGRQPCNFSHDPAVIEASQEEDRGEFAEGGKLHLICEATQSDIEEKRSL